ncbi:GyrI-like domain-containing protein [Aliifodinibius salicampi]|uniref:GyrI-like domain-containing protein n=1 Tax=Fodinibius salicampi TaxID=1920655 RepID=A0ABT3Q2L2_9BACT|nr:effector binding domain-containing protein [Fodinibius salicampi]MCW9714337.1 GyrI-like domain-containing protein [Fodinibius salicampi]
MKIVEKEAFTVIGIKVEADWQSLHKVMPPSWEKAKGRLNEIEGRKEDVMMDVSLDVTDGQYTQLIGVEVEKDSEVPDKMEKVDIPIQKYIYEQHQGALEGIAETFGRMYDWAEENDIEAGDFKIDYGYRKGNSDQVHELYIKVL